MKIVGIISAFVAIIALEAPALIKKKMWWDLAVFSGLMLVAAILTITNVFNLPFIRPTDVVNFVFKPIADVIVKILS